MKAEIDFETLYNSEVLLDFFFRKQAKDTLSDLLKASDSTNYAIVNAINSATEDWDLDDVEEEFYSESISDIIDDLNLSDYGIEFPFLEED